MKNAPSVKADTDMITRFGTQTKIAQLQRRFIMDKMNKTEKSNLFGALKLIEQLYYDGLISRHIFYNILQEYSQDVDVTMFRIDENTNSERKEKADVL